MTNKEIVENAFLDFEIPLGTAKLLEKFGRKVAKATCKQYEGEIEVLKAEIFRLDNLRKDIRLATLKEVLKLINEIIVDVEKAGYNNPQDNGYMNALHDIKEQLRAKIKLKVEK